MSFPSSNICKIFEPKELEQTDIDVFNFTKLHPHITVILYVKYNSTSIAGSSELHFIDEFSIAVNVKLWTHMLLSICMFVNKYLVCLHLIILGITPSFKLSCICLSWSTYED